MPKISEKDSISLFIKLEFFVWTFLIIIQIPIPEKIIKTEWNKNDCGNVVVACSDTESTNGSVVVKNGFIAFIYLWLEDGKKFESEGIEKAIAAKTKSASKNNRPFLCLFLELLFWIKIQETKNSVETISEIPHNPDIFTRSNIKEVKIVQIV